MYDLLIKGGRVIDPSQDIDGPLDVAITDGKVATLEKDVSRGEARRIVEAGGKVVTPGLIDLHCHVAGDIVNKLSVDPDLAGVDQAVTTVVDGGSTGESIFNAFPKYIIPSSRTRVFCFLHLSSQGLSIMPELRDWKEVNPDAMATTIQAHKDLIKGVKLRLLGNIVAADGIKVVHAAKKVAKLFALPIMIHIGDYESRVSPNLTREMLDILEPGDILSHIYTYKFGSTLDKDGRVLPELKEAMARGVILDTALGRSNFNFQVARRSLDQGIVPTTISTDIGYINYRHPVYGLAVTMSKFLALGLDLTQIVRMTTINPARAIREDASIGSLKPGREADVSILEVRQGKWRLEDSEGQTLDVERLLAPSLTIRAGQIIPVKPGLQPRQLA